MRKTKWIKTAHKGLRFHEHPTRKHGKKPDRYYAVRFRIDGKLYEYGIGWWSDRVPEEILKKDPHKTFEEYAIDRMKEYKANIKYGSGPKSPKERRTLAKEKEEQERVAMVKAEKQNLTYGDIFENQYLPIAKQNKSARAWKTENSLNNTWILPVIGEIPLRNISVIHLERIKKNMFDSEKAPRSVQYALAVVRQVFNYAHAIDIYSGDNPVTKVKKPTPDNRRLRFLTHAEADALLAELSTRSKDVHDMALLSLHGGSRAGETFSLTWGDIDMGSGIITLRNTKSTRTRYIYMTAAIKDMLKSRHQGKKYDLVFPAHTGSERNQISKTFNLVINKLGFNEGISDKRQKVVWHTLRHTFASWHIEAGTDLYTLKELMGHSIIQMTERYSHLGQNTLQQATRIFERGIGNNKHASHVIPIKK
ncbi:MAG TPA: site-specific integrase [Smithellaceae bacterium]|nr:site-specific integrase [Smithellaceae bacterium]